MEEFIDYAVQKFFSKWQTKKAVEPPAKNWWIEPDVFKDSSNSSDNNTDLSFGDTENNFKAGGDDDAETD